MEVSLQSSDSLRLKGKHASVFINPADKNATYNAAILLGNPVKSSLKINDEAVVIDGPGEYEAGGIKITGTKAGEKTVYSLVIDGVSVLLGDRDALDTIHQKLAEHNIVIVRVDSVGNADFASSLSASSILFFGTQAKALTDASNRENTKEMGKYSVAVGKFPAETETILLLSS